MVTEKTRNELKKLFNSVVIIPFDKPKLDRYLDGFYKQKYPYEPGETFSTHRPMGYIKGTNLIIDPECIGTRIRTQSIPIEIYGERKMDNGVQTDIYPRYTHVQSLTDLISNYGLPETSIENFMGSRFAYNDRIEHNMRIILREMMILAS
jgi:hypothetical protein